MAAAECNYREVDQQLKEQFIHGLNDKVMLEEVIRELTSRNNDEQTTSEGVLAWVERVEVQRAQASILSDITESCQFDKIKMVQRSKGGQDKQTPCTTSNRQPCRYCGGIHMCEGTRYDVWLVYDSTSIPRQLRFSLYSGAVITEGLM